MGGGSGGRRRASRGRSEDRSAAPNARPRSSSRAARRGRRPASCSEDDSDSELLDAGDAYDALAERYEAGLARRKAGAGGGGGGHALGAVGAVHAAHAPYLATAPSSGADAPADGRSNETARSKFAAYLRQQRSKRSRAQAHNRRQAAAAKRESALREMPGHEDVGAPPAPGHEAPRAREAAGLRLRAALRRGGPALGARPRAAAAASPSPAVAFATSATAAREALARPAAPSAATHTPPAPSPNASTALYANVTPPSAPSSARSQPQPPPPQRQQQQFRFGTVDTGVVDWSTGLESALDAAVGARRAARASLAAPLADALNAGAADLEAAAAARACAAGEAPPSLGGTAMPHSKPFTSMRSTSGGKLRGMGSDSSGSLEAERQNTLRSEVLALNSQLEHFRAPKQGAAVAVARLMAHWDDLMMGEDAPGAAWQELVSEDARKAARSLRAWHDLRECHLSLRDCAVALELRAGGSNALRWPCAEEAQALCMYAQEAADARRAVDAHAVHKLGLDEADMNGLALALGPLLHAGALCAYCAAAEADALAAAHAAVRSDSAGQELATRLAAVRPVMLAAADVLDKAETLRDAPGNAGLVALRDAVVLQEPALRAALRTALRSYAEALIVADGAAVAARLNGRSAVDEWTFSMKIARAVGQGADEAVVHDYVPVAVHQWQRVGAPMELRGDESAPSRGGGAPLDEAQSAVSELLAARACVSAASDLSERLNKEHFLLLAPSEIETLRKATVSASEHMEAVAERVARAMTAYRAMLRRDGPGAWSSPDGRAADELLSDALALAQGVASGPFSDEGRFDGAMVELFARASQIAKAALEDFCKAAEVMGRDAKGADDDADDDGDLALASVVAHVVASMASLLGFAASISESAVNPVSYDYTQRASGEWNAYGQRLTDCFAQLLRAYTALPSKLLGTRSPTELRATDAWLCETLCCDVVTFALDLWRSDFAEISQPAFTGLREGVTAVAAMLPALRRSQGALRKELEEGVMAGAKQAAGGGGAAVHGSARVDPADGDAAAAAEGTAAASVLVGDGDVAPPAHGGSPPSPTCSLSGQLRASLSADALFREGEERSWEIPLEALDLQNLRLGAGSFGEVWLAKWCGTAVAVKVLSSSTLRFETDLVRQRIAKEVAMHRFLNHENVVRFYGVGEGSPVGLYVVMEHCRYKSLYDTLKEAREVRDQAAAGHVRSPPGFYDKVAQNAGGLRLLMALGAAKGMAYLQAKCVWHRDVKTPNILIDKNGTAKIADYGHAERLDPGEQWENSGAGRVTNTWWLSPERLMQLPHDAKSDVWAFGVCLWECLTMERPWKEQIEQHGQRIHIVISAHANPEDDRFEEYFGEGFCGGCPAPTAQQMEAAGVPAEVGERVLAIIAECFRLQPENRPNFVDIVARLSEALELYKSVCARRAADRRAAARRAEEERRTADESRARFTELAADGASVEGKDGAPAALPVAPSLAQAEPADAPPTGEHEGRLRGLLGLAGAAGRAVRGAAVVFRGGGKKSA